MPDATITSTASTFGTITGTFAADQSTITGTVTGVVVGTLDGSVGVPGIGVPDGGTTGQVLKKASNTSYDTVWGTDLNAPAWGNITGTLSSQTDLQTALDAKAPLASPAFTGNPTAPTAALADNDTSLATTAFVQQELASGVAVAKNLEVYVRNQTGSTLTAGTIVYINGATGNRPTVTKAQANNDANSAQTFGFVKTSIANNGFGYVIVRGECENLDTQGLTEGAQLYLSPTTAGTWTTTKPSAPQHLVYVGIVVRAHPTQGVILVAIQNGYELNEIHDVLIDTPSNGQVLKYDAAQGLWINGTDSSGVAWGGITGTLSSQTDLNTALGLKYDASNPSGFIDAAYLTTNNYATQSWVTGQNYITTAALSPYAPLSGASFSGLIVTAASSTSVAGFKLTLGSTPTSPVNGSMWGTSSTLYFRINDISETFAFQSWVTSQLSSYAPLASPALTGTPTSTTAAADTNTTQIATTAYVVGQASSTSPVMDGSATVGTSLKYARADHVHPTDTSLAPLASPALTGTPTAPTASAGTNTTQIATTAFVTAAVPAFGATADINSPSSTTKAASIDNVREMMLNPGYQLFYLGVGVSGTGLSGYYNSNGGRYKDYQSSTTSGSYGQWCFDTNANSQGYVGFTRGQTSNYHDWSKKIWLAGRCQIGTWNSGGNGDANGVARIGLGGRNGLGGGDFSVRGIGWKVAGGGSAALVLTVHNGSTLTNVTSSFTPTLRQAFDWKLYSDGAGNVTLYVNDSQVATTSSGPTGNTTNGLYFEGVDAIATVTTVFTLHTYGTKIYHST